MIKNLRRMIKNRSSHHKKVKCDDSTKIFEEISSEASFCEDDKAVPDVPASPMQSSNSKLDLPPLTPQGAQLTLGCLTVITHLPPLSPHGASGSTGHNDVDNEDYYPEQEYDSNDYGYDNYSADQNDYGYGDDGSPDVKDCGNRDDEQDYGYGYQQVNYGYGDSTHSDRPEGQRKDRRRSLGPDSGKPGTSRRLSLGRASIRRRTSIGNSSHHSGTKTASQAPVQVPRRNRARRHSIGVPSGSARRRRVSIGNASTGPAFQGGLNGGGMGTTTESKAEQGVSLGGHLSSTAPRVRPRRRYSIGTSTWESRTVASSAKSVSVNL